jgi:predicted Holliday junction resolvase-like endonuclease|tara:strand:- start:36 stop:314 length:279 start_codon:yes stop_codon:yes gene_type:complete
MEITTAYTFGALTVITILLVVVIVIGIVKVLKQQKMIQSINREIEFNNLEFHNNIADQYGEMKKLLDETYRHTDSRVDKLEAKLTSQKLIKG